ncbi:MAG: hypothetical protein JRJ85_09515 [Deltaproteobacteria bacterium]|nr:hypothetical protein [Deltaproteobacteria bacterium]
MRYLKKVRSAKARIVQPGGATYCPSYSSQHGQAKAGKPEGLPGSQAEQSSFYDKITKTDKGVNLHEKSLDIAMDAIIMKSLKPITGRTSVNGLLFFIPRKKPRMESGIRKDRGSVIGPECSMRFFYGGEL